MSRFPGTLVNKPKRDRRTNGGYVSLTDGLLAAQTCFDCLPALTTVAAGSNNMFVTTGTGTEVVGRDTSGRFNLKSQASTPADNDNILLVPANTTNGFNQTFTATSKQRLAFSFSLNTITALFFSAGWDENITDADPTGTTGDGCKLLFIPSAVATSELANQTDFDAASFTTAQRANILLAYKVAGTDTFADTGVVMTASQVYNVEMILGTDLKVTTRINGVKVGLGPAHTANAAMRFSIGAELTATPGGQKDFSVVGASVWRP